MARLIDQAKKVGAVESATNRVDGQPPQAKAKVINVKKETTLDENIRFLEMKKELKEAAVLVYHHIFLTGCTGK